MEDEKQNTVEKLKLKYSKGSTLTDKEVALFYISETSSPLTVDKIVGRAIRTYLELVQEGFWCGDTSAYILIKTKVSYWYTQPHTLSFKTNKKGRRLAFLPLGELERQYIYVENITNLKEVNDHFNKK